MRNKITPQEFIRQLARIIGKKFHPQKIILFGSYALGNPRAESDMDILVIFPGKTGVKRRYVDISKEIGHRPFPIDLLVRSSGQIAQRLRMGDSFIEDIMAKGRVIYES